MPTIFSHAAVPLAVRLGLGPRAVPGRLLVCGIVGSALPDLDVIGLRFGVPYASEFGHRGFSHSLLFAVLVALLGAAAWRWLRAGFGQAFAFLFLCVASHGLLDAFTNGGMGVALLWPFSAERYFAPFRVIEVSPMGIRGFLSTRSGVVLLSELIWIWIPSTIFALVLYARKRRRQHPA